MEIYLLLLVVTPPLMLINLLYVANKVREDHKQRRGTSRVVGGLASAGACASLCMLAISAFWALMSV